MSARIEHAWAVVVADRIQVRSVSDTRRAAIVNFLVTDRRTLILTTHSDEDIERLWDEKREDALCAAVSITQVGRAT